MSEQRQSANIGDSNTMQKIEYWTYTVENNGTSRSLPLNVYSISCNTENHISL